MDKIKRIRKKDRVRRDCGGGHWLLHSQLAASQCQRQRRDEHRSRIRKKGHRVRSKLKSNLPFLPCPRGLQTPVHRREMPTRDLLPCHVPHSHALSRAPPPIEPLGSIVRASSSTRPRLGRLGLPTPTPLFSTLWPQPPTVQARPHVHMYTYTHRSVHTTIFLHSTA